MQQQQQQLTSASAPTAGMGEAPAGSAMVYMPLPTECRYKERQSRQLGITQIVVGVLCFVFNSVCLGAAANDYYGNGLGVVGHGYWCGILFVVTGIFGVTASKKKTKCQIITFMVLCIISAAFTIALLVTGIIGALTTRYYSCQQNYGYNYDNNYYPYYRRPCNTMANYQAIVAMESLLAIAGVVEAVVAIWGAAICCRSGICCCSTPTLVLPSAGYFPHTGQMIYIGQTPGGQYAFTPQPTFSYNQGVTPPPTYLQPGWAMPTTNIGPVLGQAPPAYMANQAQPVWMIPPSATGYDQSAVQASSACPAQYQTKEGAEF